jgi:hypothetical protein
VSAPLERLTWPLARLGEALSTVARHDGLSTVAAEVGTPPENLVRSSPDAVGLWIEASARLLGLEAEPTEMFHADVRVVLRSAAPALLRIGGGAEPSFLALAGASGRSLRVLPPDSGLVTVPLEEV